MHPACESFRDDWLEGALDAPAGRRASAHADECAVCAAWVVRRRNHVAALFELPRRVVPAPLADSVAADLMPGARTADGTATCFEARLERRLATLPRHSAPAVLDRLVAEELAAPEAARARRFAGDLGRPAVPGALARRLALGAGADRGRRARRLAAAGVAIAAALLAVVLVLRGDPDPKTRPFVVMDGPPPTPNALGTELAVGWTGGSLRMRVEDDR